MSQHATTAPPFRITQATANDLADVSALFHAYAATLPVDLNAQRFIEEVADLPGAYGAPAGALLIARSDDGGALGCVALRRLDDAACEMKRLYVDPATRGSGLGRALVEAVIEQGRRLGYREIKLDTLPHMQSALALYRRLGFKQIAPYGNHPYPGLICLGRPLDIEG